MKKIKALWIAILIWILGVSAFSLIYMLPILEDPYLQANIGLALVVPFLVWRGSRLYYRNGATAHGLKLGLVMLLVSTSLDALITVPLLIIPFGGSYASFFGSTDFWLIALEFLGTCTLYWYLRIRPSLHTSIKNG